MLGRTFFGNELWLEKRTFSRAEAWLDFLQTAAFAPGRRLIAGHLVEVPRGGIVASVRFLSDRWKWSNTKVCLFLDCLEKVGMISREKRQGNTVILLCNYEKYNTEKRRRDDAETTTGRHRDDEIEEGIIRKREIDKRACATPTLDEVLAAADRAAIPEDHARAFWNAVEARPLTPEGGWTRYNGQPMEMNKWQHALAAFAASVQRNQSSRGGATGKPKTKGQSKYVNEF